MWIIASSSAYEKGYKRAMKRHPFAGAFMNNRKFSSAYEGSPIPLHVVECGVNTDFFTMKKLRVGYYGKGRGHKNTAHIESQLAKLPHVKLVPIENLKGGDLVHKYQSLDYFVSWESHGGWCNTASEALACGAHVVTNGMNCEPFLDHVTVVSDLRGHFENLRTRLDHLSWRAAAGRIIEVMEG